MSIRVLLVDDHKIVRDGLEGPLRLQSDIVVAGHAENGLQAIDSARAIAPDIVVMNVGTPELGGVQATRRIAGEMPELHVLALSMHSDWGYVAAMLDAGASGYVLKDNAFEELATAIRKVAAGGSYTSPGIRRSGLALLREQILDTEPSWGPHAPAAELLCKVVEMRNPYTASHQRRVAELATMIAEDLGTPTSDVDEIRDAALMHDIGKMAVPAEIMAKPDPLTET
ncbi:MAG: response regulator [Actinobacteria bacterium]|nr:response regulator [Actinomycetota bacterium]